MEDIYYEQEDLLVNMQRTLDGKWIATVPRYPDAVGRGVTEGIAMERLRQLVIPRLEREKAASKGE